ncbi:hypothetical protein PHET_10526 [Paragonimus heterotremus]|uniref:DUF4806 domain-containing protein n=1 Tax=Paragonimus heterotremus TaxID=100268 RepID=A0A8J4WDZ3_9TREM|nr:hypothetical protein PHET_10526 [Paragonimus heterotremus]
MARNFSPPNTSKPAVMPAMFKSPARTQQELDERETELANSQVYDVVLKSLCRMGGTDVADTIRRMMSFLIHNDLAVLMNWNGVCNKRAACDLPSTELVQGDFSSQSSLSYVLLMPSLASRGTPTFLSKSCWYICDVGTEMRATERVVAQSVLRSRQNQRMSTWMPTSNVCQVQV